MSKIWKQICKECEKEFEYSDYSLRRDLSYGYIRPERCPKCREQHGKDINKIACPFFQRKPRKAPLPILGLPYLGHVDHKKSSLRSVPYKPHHERMKISISKEEIQKLYQAIQNHQVIIIEGPTGCGKSSFIPYRLIEPLENYPRDFFTRNGPIIITQPRIPPTKGIPIATGKNLLGSPVGAGYEIGFRFRGEYENYDRYNRLIFVTDGTLLNWIQEGKLCEYSIVIIDEAHERSNNIDLILSFLRQELPKYPHLKLIISSATIDTKSFDKAFKDITKPYLLTLSNKRKFELKINYWEGKHIPEERMPEAVAEKILEILRKTDNGGILGFLQGKREIEKAIEKIKKSLIPIPRTENKWRAVLGYLSEKNKTSLSWIFPLYRELGEKLINEKILKEKVEPVYFNGRVIIPRRVVITTNIAETSLTVPDAKYVVDSGMIKQTEWDSDVRTTFLVPKRHSRDGCRQRWGRVGRTASGEVFTLYTKQDFKNNEIFKEHTSPEITRSCLEDVILIVKSSGVRDFKKFPWINSPDQSEIKRATEVIKERNIIDKDGDLTEKGLELWRVQRSLERGGIDDASLLILADHFGCLIEAAIALAFRHWTGANLYHPNGLFLWDSHWTARTKDEVAKVHDGLKITCEDDLELVMKLVICYTKAFKEGKSEQWTKYYFIDEEAIIQILYEAKNIIESFAEKGREKIRKEINLSLLERLRILIAVAWPDREISLDATASPITFKFKGKAGMGTVSRFASGVWKNQEKAICGAAIKETTIIKGEKKELPSTCFLVKIPDKVPKDNIASITSVINQLQEKPIDIRERLFLDQKFPIRSLAITEEKDEKVYLSVIKALPQPIKVNFRKPEHGETEMIKNYNEDLILSDEETKAKKKYKKGIETFFEDISKKEVELFKDYLQKQEFIQAIWVGNKKREEVNITEWIDQNGMLIPIISSVNESDAINSKTLKRGDSIRVKVQRVERDRNFHPNKNPYSVRGWLIARILIGLDIPVDSKEMTLSPLGYGLETLEGKRIRLAIKNINEGKNLIKLSNIDNVIVDLKKLYREAKEKKKSIQIEGYVEEVNEEEENTVVIASRESGVIHSFEIYKDFVPEKNINNLQIGEKIVIELSPRDKDKISTDFLDEKEIKSFSQKWNYNETENIIDLPCCLEDEDLKNQSARPEIINFVKKHSWQYCFGARIIDTASYREIYGALKISSYMKGKVVEIIKNRDEKPVGINVQIEVLKGKFPIIAFMSKGELTWKISKNSPLEVVIQEIRKFENEIISVRVLNIDSTTYPPKLFLTRKEAFKAEASIPFSGIPILIGRRGENIRNIIGNKDVDIDIDRTGGKVTIKAPSQLIRDDICKEIDSQISGMGGWTKR